MKTAISLPDDIFEKAELLARRTRKSRSRLFSDAVEEYVARHASDEITEAMDRALDHIGIPDDGLASTAASHALRKVEW